jgi:D-alanyl-D-alanine carboxypeptidase/D-alanyl-D-alanine-endopeptidase (penicillin-binding protein 4)
LNVLITACKVSPPRMAGSHLDRFMDHSPVFGHSHTGLMIYDPEEDRTLYGFNEQDLFTPASNTKLWTVYAGLKMLGDSIPSVRYCERRGKLHVQAMADPTLLHPAFGHHPAITLLRSATDTVYLTIPPLVAQRFGAGWAWDDYFYDFQPERSALPLYGNVVHISQQAPTGFPDIYPEYFVHGFHVQCDSGYEAPVLRRAEYANTFELKYACEGTAFREVIPYVVSDSLSGILLQQALDQPVLLHADDIDGCQWEVVYSHPVDSLYKHILTDSDNFMAEQLLLMCANAHTDTLNPEIAIKHILTQDFPGFENEIHWIDGSGLSRYNQFTPQSMVHLLSKMYASVGTDRLCALLPAGGRSGTLQNAFAAQKPYIFAKTGSMRYVYNLSGYLRTDSGKFLIFSFMNNHFNVSFDVLKSAMNDVLTKFKEKY